MTITAVKAAIKSIPIRSLFGIPVHAATMKDALEVCILAIQNRGELVIGVVNAAKVVNMRREPVLYDAVVKSDLVLADGMGIVWASRILGRPLPERVPGIDLFENLLQIADEKGASVFFLGATQEVLDRVVELVRSRFPCLRVAGSQNGYH